MEVLQNIWVSYGEILTVFFVGILLGAFIIFALDLILTEYNERKIYNILYKRMEIEEYIDMVSALIAKSKKVSRKIRYSIYKAIGLYYKGDNEQALEWLKKVSSDIPNCEDKDVKYHYALAVLKILFRMPYSDAIAEQYKANKDVIEQMKNIPTFKFDAFFLEGVYKSRKGKYKEAYEALSSIEKTAINKLDRVMLSFELIKACIHIDRLEEAETRTEEVMNTKKSSKNSLFVYAELEELAKEQRGSTKTISSVDKDLEEQKQQEALEKLQKEVEVAIEETKNKLDEEENIAAVEEATKSDEDKKIDEQKALEEEFNKQLSEQTASLYEDMKVSNNVNK